MRKDHTLLYTDLVDSTALNTRLGDAGMALLWDEHDRRSRELLRQWRGREIDRSDGFLVLFEQPADALAFCSHYHRMLTTLPVPLRARAGMHLGPLTLRENSEAEVALGAKPTEVVGIAKAMAARLMALALGGQTLASPSAHQALREDGALAGPWRSVSHGHWRLKGMEGVLEIFEVGDAHCAFVPPADSEKSQRMVQMAGMAGAWVGVREVPHKLPAERDSFVGRNTELQQITGAYADGARLLTITGPGGMGKTRLALRYAWSWLGDHPGGVWFCDLASARSIDRMVQAVGQGLDVPLGNDPVGQLGRAIAGRGRCLIILDNFEQLRPHARDTLGLWLDAAREAHFLVTSREVLNLAGESMVVLAPLAPQDATALFHQRARAAHAAHDPVAEPEATQALVAMLDGMPLAIELAAPRVRVMATPELLARMSDRFRLLAAGSGRPDRQATLRATLAWSWDLLSPDERAVLAQLAVFEGGFAWPAVQVVVTLGEGQGQGAESASAELDHAPWIIDLLQSLVDKSLVAPQLGARFSLLRSVQEFAAAELARPGSFPGSGAPLAAAVRRRHYVHYAGLNDKQAVAGRCVELGNLVHACEQAVADDAPDAAVELLRLAWTALRMTGPFVYAVRMADKVRAMPSIGERQLLWVDHVTGRAQLAIGNTAQALEAAQRTLAAAESGQSPLEQAAAWALLGEVEMGLGDYVASAASLERALHEASSLDTSYWTRWVLNAQGALLHLQGQVKESRECFARALSIVFAEGDKHWQASLLGNLAGLHFAEGQLEQARKVYTEALSISGEVGSRRFEGSARCNLGLVLHELGHHDAAMQELTLALDAARTMGYARLAHVVQCNLGLVAEARADLAAAVRFFKAARDGACASNESRSEAQYNAYLATAQCRLGAPEEAAQSIARARELLAAKPDVLAEGLLHCCLIELHLQVGRAEEGRTAYAQAQQLLTEQGWHADSELGRRLQLIARRLGL